MAIKPHLKKIMFEDFSLGLELSKVVHNIYEQTLLYLWLKI